MKRRLGKIAAAFLVLVLATGAATRAQAPTFTVLHSFTNSGGDGALPPAGLVIDAAGNLYGTTSQGGSLACSSGVTNAVGCGTVFKLDPSGNETILYSFTAGSDGALPAAGLIMDAAGNLYGTTAVGGGPCPSGFGGGFPGCGSVFKLDAAGTETVLHRFTLLNGVNPRAGLIMDSAGNLYGTAEGNGPGGSGTVFKLDPAGNLTVLHAFTGGSDGVFPFAGLVMDVAGNLYGTTFFGGGSSTCGGAFGGCGIVFKVDPSGNETVLHSFTGPDGLFPVGGLIMDPAGNLYGTTSSGGASSSCPGVSNVVGCGTVFKLDTSGNLTVLHSFTNSGGDGAQPVAGLILDKAGNLYGTTQLGGGSSSAGTVFKLDASRNLTVLHSFSGVAGGGVPLAPLIMDNAGNLYGTTFFGGSSSNCSSGCGTVFKLTPASTVSTPPNIIVSFPAPPSGQDGFFKAGQTPVVGSVSASDPSNVTAISCSDSLGDLTAGALTGGGTTSASESLSVNGDGIHVISCTATDGAGNSGAAPGSVNTATIQIDTTPPTITFSGNQGTYTVDQTVSITTTATDALSGVATLSTQPLPNSSVTCATGTRCANFTAPAHSLGPGTHTISATATDGAGNAASASTSFTVLTPQQATQRIINSVNTLFSQGVINGGQDNSLSVQLQHAIAMMNAGKNNGAIGNLDSFISEVNDLLSSGVLSPSQAASLTVAAQSVIAAL